MSETEKAWKVIINFVGWRFSFRNEKSTFETGFNDLLKLAEKNEALHSKLVENKDAILNHTQNVRAFLGTYLIPNRSELSATGYTIPQWIRDDVRGRVVIQTLADGFHIAPLLNE